jgi:hypothetical protein
MVEAFRELAAIFSSCPGRDAAFFMPLRRTGIPVYARS